MGNKKILTFSIIGILAIIVIVLLVMVINSNKSISLTKDNFNDYFNITTSISAATSREFFVVVNATSTNFNYENVEVEIEVKGKETKKVIVKCDIAGKGKELISQGAEELKNFSEPNISVINVKGKIKPVGK